ncbi:hypothetical protein M422DRAFT_36135, partial [Sphaerobolus stellatus SS14]
IGLNVEQDQDLKRVRNFRVDVEALSAGFQGTCGINVMRKLRDASRWHPWSVWLAVRVQSVLIPSITRV